MSAYDEWLTSNDIYLGVALAWLHDRLKAMALPTETRPAPTPAASSASQASFCSQLFREKRGGSPAAALPPARPEATGSPALSIPPPSAMLEAEGASAPPALVLLAQRLGLSEFERHTLLLCIAMELGTGTGILCARAQRDSARPYPTFALALALFDNPEWNVLSPECPLRYWRILEINQPGAQPLITSALRADERIVNYVKGLNYLDDRLAALMRPVVHPAEIALPASQSEQAALIVEYAIARNDAADSPVIQLLGADSRSKHLVAGEAASRLGVTLYRLPAEALPTQASDLENLARLWQRETLLQPLALYLDCAHIVRESPLAETAQRLLGHRLGLVFVDTRETWPDMCRESLPIDIARPSAAEQRQIWIAVVGEAYAEAVARITSHFSFDAITIMEIAHATLALNPDASCLGEALWNACRQHARPALDRLAQPLEPKAAWDDLVLPAAEKDLLRKIADQIEHRGMVYGDWGFGSRMNRGLGISVLFAGESGTGKTMAAEVIAMELGLLLYRIDLSAVVSKYIGETEKNLRRLFDAAEDGGAILFFDEADALFGRRSEVKDSHDRYANIEVNYLLQRMESYRGLAILATNMKGALDTAFVRRLRFIINFPFPGPTERAAIWRKAFPPATPLGVIDWPRLGRLNLTGGSIHAIALNAAFFAAEAGTPVTMSLLLEAARIEFYKLDKPINEADFRLLETVGAPS